MVWNGRATKEKFGRGFSKFFTSCAEVYEVPTPTTALTLLYAHIYTLNSSPLVISHSCFLTILTPPATMHPQDPFHSLIAITILTK